MSRWFRHYAGMCRDDKLVRAALRSKQTIERVVWIWAVILESAAEINDGGRYEIDHAEIAYFLRSDEADVAAVEGALRELGRVSESSVARWASRQFQSDRSAERTKRYRDRHQGSGDGYTGRGDGDVTSQGRHGDAPETETERELEEEKERTSPPSTEPREARPSVGEGEVRFEDFQEGFPHHSGIAWHPAVVAWDNLTASDRRAAIAALPAFRKDILAKPTTRPMSPRTFLVERRWEGFTAQAPPELARQFRSEEERRIWWDNRHKPEVAA